MKPLTLEETGLKEELKRQYYEKEKLGIKNSRENFEMLCHLEDFEIQYWELLKENKQLKQQLLIAQTNEETFRLEMEDITKTLGLDENTLFDDVKVCVKNLKDNWNKLKEYTQEKYDNPSWASCGARYVLEKMQELEGSDSNEI